MNRTQNSPLMHFSIRASLFATLLTSCLADDPPPASSAPVDAFSWLENITAPQSLEWVRQENKKTFRVLKGDPRYERFHQIAAEAVDEELSAPQLRDVLIANHVYHLRRGRDHPRGLWQRAAIGAYVAGQPQWETLLDIDELARVEGKPWVFSYLIKGGPRRCIIVLSEAGDHTGHFREFDLVNKRLVPDGFNFSKGMPVWLNDDLLLISLDGTLLEWSRGQMIEDAKTVFAADPELPRIAIQRLRDTEGRALDLAVSLSRTGSSFNYIARFGEGQFQRIRFPVAIDPHPSLAQGQFVFQIEEPWQTHELTVPTGSILSVPVQALFESPETWRPSVVHVPGSREMIFGELLATTTGVLVVGYKEVRPQLHRFTFKEGKWRDHPIPLPDFGAIRVFGTDLTADWVLARFESFTIAPIVYAINVKSGSTKVLGGGNANAGRYRVVQHHATSSDGMPVPYFVVSLASNQSCRPAPTLVHGYGGEIAQLAWYSATLRRLWIDQGGVYVVANIRGGEEFGPSWKVKGIDRRFVHDDFIAVAEDLIDRGVTVPAKLGMKGHSAGGELMGVISTLRPDLFNAVVLECPPLDYFRPDLMSSPFGDPERGRARMMALGIGPMTDPVVKAYLERTSPFQNLKARTDFPVQFIVTSTTDAQVHPGFARRYAAKLASLGMPYLYFESSEGGHGIVFTPEQRAEYEALRAIYFTRRLADPADAHTTP